MGEEPALAWAGAGIPAGGTGRRFNGRIATDSRKVKENELFIAIEGKNHDAHAYVNDVIEKGVAAVLVHKQPAPEVLMRAQLKDVAVLLVEDTVAALNRLAAAYRRGVGGGGGSGMRAKVIAVGGSNGKTTTKRIIHALLAEKFGKDGGHASPKSFNNNIGMPLTLLEVDPSHDYVVLEIGTNAPGEIAALGEVCRPDVAVITSVGLEHLEKLGDLEGVAREEASIAPFVAEGGTLVLPADAPELLVAVRTAKAQRILVGHRPGGAAAATGASVESNISIADFMLTDVKESIDGTTFSINGRGSFRLPLLGEHNAMNALMAIAVARRLGVSDEQIAAGLLKVTPAEGRLEPLRVGGEGGWSVINDSYNANPSSMEAALKTFAKVAGGTRGSRQDAAAANGRKVVILGDMLELGPSSEAMHRSIGGMVAAWEFDLFIAIGPAMRYAADVAQAAGARVARFPDTAAARSVLLQHVLPGDRLLLKGSRGMALEALLVPLKEAANATATAAPVAAV
jgi:UDP-N-acetylmuramoyl-tripeptide--D-alanyl-D-alanine ligase